MKPCPKCGSEKVYLTDHEQLELPHRYYSKDTQNKTYGFDNEIYAMWKCGDCKAEGNIVGVILWGQLKTSEQ